MNLPGITLTIATLVATMSISSIGQAKTEPPARPVTRESITQSLSFTETLLTKSSVSVNIRKAEFPPAIAYLNEAIRLHAEAVTNLRNGDLKTAARLRDEAIRLTFEAGHLTQMSTENFAKQRSDYQSKVRSINALMDAYTNISADKGARQKAGNLRQETDKLLAQAEQHMSNKDFITASHTLGQAYSQLKSALNNIRGGETLGELSTAQSGFESQHTQYNVKLRSIQALMDAQRRIATEKDDTTQSSSLDTTVKPLLTQAAAHEAKGEYELSMAALNYAYTIVTASIEKLRGGETLIRTLKFETAEEEYHYELDRNNTYKMLIKMLINDQKTMKITDRVDEFLIKADNLRQEAEKHAQSGNFETAIKSLEQSTKSLIFAMRNAGFFVPG